MGLALIADGGKIPWRVTGNVLGDRSETGASRETYRCAVAEDHRCTHCGARKPDVNLITAEQETQMIAIYQQALWLEKMWGQKFEGDHMVPLHASHKRIRCCCGLHVPWNLWAVTERYSGDKSDLWPAFDPLLGGDNAPEDWVRFTADDSDDEVSF